MGRTFGVLLHPRHTVAVLALLAASGTVTSAHAADATLGDSHHRYAVGVTGSEIFNFPTRLSLGFVGSYAPLPYFAAGAEASRFVLGWGGDRCDDSRRCVHDGWMLLPFAEVRTPWRFPVNLFARVSVGVALANRENGDTDVLASVRAAAGPELKAGHLYLRPFVFWTNKVDDENYEGPPGLGVELGAVF